MKTTINFYGEWDVTLQTSGYPNGRMAIVAMCDNGAVFGKLTTNLPDEPLAGDEIFVRTTEENEWTPQILQAFPEVFEDTGRRVQTGYIEVQVWIVKDSIE